MFVRKFLNAEGETFDSVGSDSRTRGSIDDVRLGSGARRDACDPRKHRARRDACDPRDGDEFRADTCRKNALCIRWR